MNLDELKMNILRDDSNSSLRLDQAILANWHTISASDSAPDSVPKEAPARPSRSQIKVFFKDGKILHNGRKAKGSDSLYEGENEVVITGYEPPKKASLESATDPNLIMPIFESDDFLAFSKPSGLPTSPGASEVSLINYAIAHCPSLIESFPESKEPGLLHRLDNGTSGVVLFAKNQKTFDNLKARWKTETVQKIYRAWVYKMDDLPEPGTKFNEMMGHSKKSSKKMHLLENEVTDKRYIRGNPQKALTIIKDIRETENPDIFELEIQILTGVHHQIRVHLSHHGLPIVGDSVYGNKTLDEKFQPKRIALHAEKLILSVEEKKIEIIQLASDLFKITADSIRESS